MYTKEDRQLKTSFLCVYDNTNGRLMYVVLGGGYTQEDTLTVRLCYHTHKNSFLTDG